MSRLFSLLTGKPPRNDPDLVSEARAQYQDLSDTINDLFRTGGFDSWRTSSHQLFPEVESNPLLRYKDVAVPEEITAIRNGKVQDEIHDSLIILRGASESYYFAQRVPFALGKIFFYAGELGFGIDSVFHSEDISQEILFDAYKAHAQYGVFEQMRRNNGETVLRMIAQAGLSADSVLHAFSEDNPFGMDKWNHRAIIRRYRQVFSDGVKKKDSEIVTADTLPFELFLLARSYIERRTKSVQSYNDHVKFDKPENEVARQLDHFFYSSDESDVFLERALAVAQKHKVDVANILLNRNSLLSAGGKGFSPLEQRLITELDGKRITFADFFNRALYDPEVGLYNTTQRLAGTWDAEFKTVPHTHDEFGRILAYSLRTMWAELGKPTQFQVVEMGAGEGKLARDILAYTHSRDDEEWKLFSRSLRYEIVERNPELVQRQRQALSDFAVVVREGDALDLPYREKSMVGCFLSNELVDALAPHKVKVIDGEVKEMYVTFSQGALIEVPDAISDPKIIEYLRVNNIQLREREEAYINLAGLNWLHGVSITLQRGFVLTFDYGAPTEIVYSAANGLPQLRAYGKRCYSKLEEYDESLGNAVLQPKIDSYVHHPLSMAGCKDLTTDVDFGSLKRFAEAHGLHERFFGTQNDFLSEVCEATGYRSTNNKVLQESRRYRAQLLVRT